MRHSHVTGAFLAQLRNPARLTQVDLGETEIDDVAMELIGKMTNLEYLLLDGTRVTDAGLPHLHTLTKLKSLLLVKTQVTWGGGRELQKSLPKTTISVQ